MAKTKTYHCALGCGGFVGKDNWQAHLKKEHGVRFPSIKPTKVRETK